MHIADAVSAFLAFLLASMLIAVVMGGALQVSLSSAPVAVRAGLVAGGAAVVALSFWSLRERLPGPLTVMLASSASVAALAAAYFAARGPHTRAMAGVLFAFAFATLVRVGAWVAATRAGDSANMELFTTARNLSTAGVVLEASGQVIVFYWLGRKSRAFGQLAAFLAVAAAVAVTLGVARGGHADAAPWQAVVHSALGEAWWSRRWRSSSSRAARSTPRSAPSAPSPPPSGRRTPAPTSRPCGRRSSPTASAG